MLVIRAMKPEESEAVSKIVAEVIQPLTYYNDWARSSELRKYTPTLLREAISKDPYSVLVAENQSGIIGFCISREDDGLVWLAWFGVHPNWRGQGVAIALLEKFEETVRLRGCHKIWCDCRTENVASQAILTRLGYKRICTVRNHWYGQDFILWEKLIG